MGKAKLIPAKKFGLGLCGASGSGKTTAARYLNSKHSFQIAHTGEIIRKIALLLFGTDSKDATLQIYECLSVLPETIYFEAALRAVENPNGLIVWDSVRSKEEADHCKKIGLKLTRLSVSHELQIDRLTTRGQLFNESALRSESEVAYLQFEPDLELRNDGSNEELFSLLDSAANEIKVEYQSHLENL